MKQSIVSKEYCMSSFLTFRYVANSKYIWREDIVPRVIRFPSYNEKTICDSADDIDAFISKQLQGVDFSKTALLLSGGID